MSRLIDADKLKEDIQQSITKCDINKDCCNCCYTGCIESLDYDEIEDVIDEQPTVERPKGKWEKFIIKDYLNDAEIFKCNQCNFLKSRFTTYNYCPNCGADMKEVEE